MKSIAAKSEPWIDASWWIRFSVAANVRGILPNDRVRQRRLFDALRLDNRGAWFRCRSPWSVLEIERRFAEGVMASALYHRVGGILRADRSHLYLQIALVTAVLRPRPDDDPEWCEVPVTWPEAAVEIALDDQRIELVDRVPDITAVLRSGRY